MGLEVPLRQTQEGRGWGLVSLAGLLGSPIRCRASVLLRVCGGGWWVSCVRGGAVNGLMALLCWVWDEPGQGTLLGAHLPCFFWCPLGEWRPAFY